MRIKYALPLVLFLLAFLPPLEVYAEGTLNVKGTDYDVTVEKTSGEIPRSVHAGKSLSPVGYVLRWKEEKKHSGTIELKTSKAGSKI